MKDVGGVSKGEEPVKDVGDVSKGEERRVKKKARESVKMPPQPKEGLQRSVIKENARKKTRKMLKDQGDGGEIDDVNDVEFVPGENLGESNDSEDDFEDDIKGKKGNGNKNKNTSDEDRVWSLDDLVMYPYPNSKVKNRNCIACEDRVFPSWSVLRDHFRAKHLGVYYTCDRCLPVRRFQNYRDFCDHDKKRHEETNKYVYDCPKPSCSEAFRTQKQLDSHVVLHHPTTKFPCTVCGKSYATKYLLKDHNCSGEEEPRAVYVCQHCTKEFYTRTNFNRHRLYVHEKKTSFTCVCCGKSFSSPQARSFHTQNCKSASTAGAAPLSDEKDEAADDKRGDTA